MKLAENRDGITLDSSMDWVEPAGTLQCCVEIGAFDSAKLVECKSPVKWEEHLKALKGKVTGDNAQPVYVKQSELYLFWFKAMFWINVATLVATLLGCLGLACCHKFLGGLGGCLTCLANTTAFVFLILGATWIFGPAGKLCAGKVTPHVGTMVNAACEGCGPLWWKHKGYAVGGFYQLTSATMAVLIIIQFVLICCCCVMGCCFATNKKKD